MSNRNLRLKLVLEAIDKMTSPMKGMSSRFTETMKKMEKATKALSDRLSKMGESMKGFGKNMSLYVSTTMSAVGLLSIRAAARVDTLTTSLSGLAGGTDKAKALMKELSGFADRSGQSLESVTAAAGKLMAGGYKDGNLLEQMRRLTTVAAGSQIELEELAKTVAKSRNSGVLEKGDLEMLQEKQIPIVETLSEVLGKSRAAVMKLANEGKITAKDMERAFGRMTSAGGAYANTLDDQANSITGLLKSWRFNMDRIFADLGADITKEFNIAGKIKMATDAMRGLADAFMGLPKPVKSLIVNLGLILAIAGPVIMFIGQMVIGIGAMISGFTLVAPAVLLAAGAFKALGLALLTTPIGWIMLGITALAGAAFLLFKNWGKVKAFFADIWGGIKQVFADGVAAVMKFLSPVLSAINFVRNGFGKIKNAVTNNPVADFARNHSGTGSASSTSGSTAGYTVPVAGAATTQKVDTGGTLRIKVDTENRVSVVESRPNDRRMELDVDTGQLMGAM